MGGFAWVTLATNDSYSLGALVLAQSLKRSGTCHQLAVLVTPGVTNAMRAKLSSVFNVIQEVNILDSKDDTNLRLLKRPELGITFTKLHCWRLTQFEKCVFLDADTLVLKNSDELFQRSEFSAAPDVGWPDCFNSGVFVFRPSNETYEKLVQFALENGSFDGGDQGLLNLYFSDWSHKDINKHLPFIYNMCSTACYSYLPAFKQFGSEVKIVHFISSTKPWLQYFDTESKQVQPAGDMQHLKTVLQCWWDIFCSVIHPNLTSDMNRSTTSNEHKVSIDSVKYIQPQNLIEYPLQGSDYKNVWDPWEKYENKYFPPPSEPPPHYNEQNNENPIGQFDTNPYLLEICNSEQEISQHNKHYVQTFSHPPCIETPCYEIPPSHLSQYETSPPLLIPQNYSPPPIHQYEPPPPHKEYPTPNPHDEQHSLTTFNFEEIITSHFNQPQSESPHSQNNESQINQHIDKFPLQETHFEQKSNTSPSIVPNLNKSMDHELRIDCSSSLVDTPLYCNDQDDCNGGLAGAFAQFSLGSPRSPTQLALEDHLRRQGWEVGNIDYMGRDSFDNIWSKICETLAAGPQQDKPEESSKVEQPQNEKSTSVTLPADVKISEFETKIESNKAEDSKNADEKTAESQKLEQPLILPITSKTKLGDSKTFEENSKVEEPKSLEAPNLSEEITKTLEVTKTLEEVSKVEEEATLGDTLKTTSETLKVEGRYKDIKLVEEVPKPEVVSTTDVAKTKEEICSTDCKASEAKMSVQTEPEEKSKPSQGCVVETVKLVEVLGVPEKTNPVETFVAEPQESTMLDVQVTEPKVEILMPECSKTEAKVEFPQIEYKPDNTVEEKPENKVEQIKTDVKSKESDTKLKAAEATVEESKTEALPKDTTTELPVTKTKVKPGEIKTDIKLEEVKTELKVERVKTDDSKSVDAEIKASQEVIAEVKLDEVKIQTKPEVDITDVKIEEKPEDNQTDVTVKLKPTDDTQSDIKKEVKPADTNVRQKAEEKVEIKSEETKVEIKPKEAKVEIKSEESKVEIKPEQSKVEIKPVESKLIIKQEVKSEVKEVTLTPAPEIKQEPTPVVGAKKGKGKKDKRNPPVEGSITESPQQEFPKSEEKCTKTECPKEKCPRIEYPKEKCEKKDCLKKLKSKASVETKPEIPKTEVIEVTPPTCEKIDGKALRVETPILAPSSLQSSSTAPTPPPRKGSGGKKAKAKK